VIAWLRRSWEDWTQGAATAATARARARLRAHAWPPPLRAALSRLQSGGARAYLVGGSVRDVLLGREPSRVADVATSLTPPEVMARFERVEPTGIAHGTVLVIEPGLSIECTTFRLEDAYSDARHPDRVTFTDDPLADLARRDLTVNALAFDPISGELLDANDGALDLERRRLRAVGDPLARFREDALRPLRIARLAAALDMDPDEQTRAAMRRVAPEDPDGYRADGLAPERIREELDAMLRAPTPSRGLEILREAGLLDRWLPELAQCRGVPQNRFHAYDVYFHSLYTCDAAPPEKPDVRWAALLHDIGKPATRVERRGDGTFYQHEIVGAELADALLLRLRLSNDRRARIVHLIREHMFDARPEWSDSALRRWLRRVGTDSLADLFDLRIADTLGNGTRAGFPAVLDGLRRRIDRLLAESSALHIDDLAVDGRDVMRELGATQGPVVGEALTALLDEVLDDPSRNTREELIARLHRWHDARVRTERR
jgi:tRNA nucleotidyltransferase (CCA-adding enzyme)